MPLDDGQINIPYLGGVFPANIGPTGYTVVHLGHPVDGVGCARSLNVGDPLGILSGNTQYVADLNVVAQAMGTPYDYNGNFGTNTAPVAWTYEDKNGHYWVEQNPAFQPQFSVGVSAWLLSFGITPATGTYPRFAGSKPPKLPAGTGYQKCWDAGMNLVHSLLASLLLFAHPGAPVDGKTCYGSLQIGDLLGSKPWTVHDINIVKRGSSVVAWIYKDQNGKFWVEKNARAHFLVSLAMRLRDYHRARLLRNVGRRAPSFSVVVYAQRASSASAVQA